MTESDPRPGARQKAESGGAREHAFAAQTRRFLIPDGSGRNPGLATFAALALSVAPVAAQANPATAHQDAGIVAPDAGSPLATILATMTCERVAMPGRLRCEVEARVAVGASISWGDVVLRRVPPFATALRGRIGPLDASLREPGLWRWPFALVVRGKGVGDVEGQVRLVVCRNKACDATEVPVVGKVDVGP